MLRMIMVYYVLKNTMKEVISTTGLRYKDQRYFRIEMPKKEKVLSWIGGAEAKATADFVRNQ